MKPTALIISCALSASSFAPVAVACDAVSTAGFDPSASFGRVVALDGDVLVVMGQLNDVTYVYRKQAGVYTLEQELCGGRGVAISGDVIVIGVNNDERAEVFRWTGATWAAEQTLQSSLAPENGWFGRGVAVDGTTILVGASSQGGSNDGAAFVFEFDGSTWTEIALLTPSNTDFSNQQFGYAVGLSGDFAFVGAPESSLACPVGQNCKLGAVYVYRRDGGNWVEDQVLLPTQSAGPARFGRAVAVDGIVAIVGAPFDALESAAGGAAYVYAYDKTWLELQRISEPLPLEHAVRFGSHVAASAGRVATGHRVASLYYEVVGTAVGLAGRIVPCVDRVAYSEPSVALFDDHLAVGIDRAGLSGAGRVLMHDLADADADGDAAPDSCDNCVELFNPDQLDTDRDCTGDVCDVDDDNDGVFDVDDNCPTYYNPDQADCDGDGEGDYCAIAQGGAGDCNSNARPDACDLAVGWSTDADRNGVPDECQSGGCQSTADCVDVDADGVRDTPCVLGACQDNTCMWWSTYWADMCFPSDNVGEEDFLLPLSCFGDVQTACTTPDVPPYLVDVGGSDRNCALDGVCDLNDVYALENAYQGVHDCTCPLPSIYDDPSPNRPGLTGGSARVFMVPDGAQFDVPTSASPVVTLEPGTTTTLMVWLESDGAAPVPLHGYQLGVASAADPLGPATGSVTYVDTAEGIGGLIGDGGSLGVDTSRSDYVRADGGAAVIALRERLVDGYAAVASYSPNPDGVSPEALTGVHYLAEFEVATSAESSGLFVLDFVRSQNAAAPFVPLTDLFSATGERWPVEQFQSVLLFIGQACTAAADCADIDGNDVRDDNCVWWDCVENSCQPIDTVFGDVGGAFGACVPDGVADGNDRFHVLGCFANQGTAKGIEYPCETLPAPFASNVDVGGTFGDCAPDGVCDGADTFHVLLAFADVSTCACPLGGPEPGSAARPIVEVPTRLRMRRTRITAGAEFEVDVYLEGAVERLWGYQLHVEARGGQRGGLELVDMTVDRDNILDRTSQTPWHADLAFNPAHGQLVVSGVTPVHSPPGYLATLTYRVSTDAAGVFTIDLLADPHDRTYRSFLFSDDPSIQPALAPASLVLAVQSADR